MFAKVRKGILQNTTVYAPITFEETVIDMIMTVIGTSITLLKHSLML